MVAGSAVATGGYGAQAVTITHKDLQQLRTHARHAMWRGAKRGATEFILGATEAPWRADPEAYILVTTLEFLSAVVQAGEAESAEINEVFNRRCTS